MVVLPAPSSPSMTTLHCILGIFLLKIFLKILPISNIINSKSVAVKQNLSKVLKECCSYFGIALVLYYYLIYLM